MFSKDALALLPGRPVVDRDGKRIGRILDVYAASSDPTGVAAVSARIPGMRPALVPLDGAVLDGRTVRVPYTRDRVRAAPRIEVDGAVSGADTERLLDHYRPPSRDTADGPGVLDVTVTVTVTARAATDGEETGTVVEAVAGAVRDLVDRTSAELRAHPELPGSSATARVALTADPDGAGPHQRRTTPATGGSDNSVA